MPDRDEPTMPGELLVLNGKQAGQRFALYLPVTVIGSAERCDIRLSGPEVAEVHGLIIFTPAGPSLRSWAPHATLLNSLATTAAMLQDGDELQVGPCRFRFHCAIEEPILLSLADPEPEHGEFSQQEDHSAAPEPEYFTLVPVSDEEWSLQRREQELHEQERQLAAFLDRRQQQIAELHRQLIDGREQLRLERIEQEQALNLSRSRLRQQQAEIQPLHQAAQTARENARRLYRRLQERAQRQMLRQQEQLKAERARLDDEREQLRQESARHQAEAAATRRRLAEAAERLAEGQRRLLADRQQSEALAAQIQKNAEYRVQVAEHQQRLFEASRDRLEGRVQQLLEEIAHLETRATQARAALQSLEQQRARLAASLREASTSGPIVFTATGSLPDLVPLERSSQRDTEQFLQQLELRERELVRKERELAELQRELQDRLLDLADERAVCAEQVAVLTVAREQWQAEESRTVAELEVAARAVHIWEQALQRREQEATALDRQRRQQAEELTQFRVKLEGWQATLAAAEETAAAERDRRAALLNAREAYLQQWERSLQRLCRDWAEAMQRDQQALAEQRRRWAEVRQAYEERLVAWDRQAEQRLAEAVRLASVVAAVEEVRAELEGRPGAAGRQARRRLRVITRRWEQHFTRFLREFEQRQKNLAQEVADSRELHRQLQDRLEELANRQQDRVEAEGRLALERVAQERMIAEQKIPMLAVEEEKVRTLRALATVQAEVEALAARVIGMGPLELQPIEPMPGILPLHPAA